MVSFVTGSPLGVNTLYVILQASTWQAAVDGARALGGDLAVISTAEEQAQISAGLTALAAQNPAAVSGDILFGLRPDGTGGYTWANGKWYDNGSEFAGWASGEPNLSSGNWTDTATAVVLSSANQYRWNDIDEGDSGDPPAYQTAIAELPLRQFGAHGYALINASSASEAASKAQQLGGALADASSSATADFLKTFLSGDESAWVTDGQLSQTTSGAQSTAPTKALIAIPLADSQASADSIYIKAVHWPEVREYQRSETLTVTIELNQPLRLKAPTQSANPGSQNSDIYNLPLITEIKVYDRFLEFGGVVALAYSEINAASRLLNPSWSSAEGLSSITIGLKPSIFNPNSGSPDKYISINMSLDLDGFDTNDYFNFAGWQSPAGTSIDLTLPAGSSTSDKGYTVAPLEVPPTAITSIAIQSLRYEVGQTINVEVTVNQPINEIHGRNISTVTLEIGTEQVRASYNGTLSQPDAKKLVYSYTIPATSPVDADGVAVISWNDAVDSFSSMYYDTRYHEWLNPGIDDRLLNQSLVFEGVTVTNAGLAANEYTPQILASSLTISQGETKQLTSSDLAATDADSPADNSQLRFHISETVAVGFERSANGANWEPVTSFTAAEIGAGMVRVRHDGSEQKPAFSLRVSDASRISEATQAQINYIGINNFAPVLTTNQLTLSEGETLLLTSQNFAASDQDQHDENSIISFEINDLEGGRFEISQNGTRTPTNTFTQQQIEDKTVYFVDDDNDAAPRFTTSVTDGELWSSPASASIGFTPANDSTPALTAQSLLIKRGATVIITTSNLAAVDPDTGSSRQLVYRIVNLTGGRFERNTSGAWETTEEFSHEEIESGKVRFIDDGDDIAPSFSISVSDGLNSSTPIDAKVSFNLRVPELVDDINKASLGSDPRLFTKSGGYLYFVANEGSGHDQLWRSNPITGNVERLETSKGALYNITELVDVNGRLYISGHEPTAAGAGAGLFYIDATSDSEVTKVEETSASYPRSLTSLNGQLYYVATITDGAGLYIGIELAHLNPQSGQITSYDLNPGSNSSYPRALTSAYGKLYFIATSADRGEELWCFNPVTDSRPTLLRDIRAGVGSSSISNLMTSGGNLYFTASDGNYNTDEELWLTDGTPGGTRRVADINVNSYESNPTPVLRSGNALYFTATSDTNGLELYRLDSDSGTVELLEVQAGSDSSRPGSNNGGIVDLNGTLYFNAYDNTNGWELWRRQPGGSLQKLRLGAWQSNPQFLTAVGDTLYFAAEGQKNLGIDLSRTFQLDGQAVTLSFDFLRLDSWDSEDFTVMINGDQIMAESFAYFRSETNIRVGSSGGYGWSIEPISENREQGFEGYPDQLFRVTISIPEGHDKIQLGIGSELNEGSQNESYGLRNLELRSSSNPSQILLSETGTDASAWVGGRVSSSPALGTFVGRYSSETSPYLGTELWSINASTGEPIAIDINPGAGGSTPQALFNVGEKLYFTAYTPTSGYELWTVDPADNIPHLIADVNPGAESSRAPWNYATTTVAAAGGRIYFSASGSEGRELYMIEPGEEGAKRIDLNPGSVGSDPRAFTVAGGRLFFQAFDGNGWGLFSTEPTTGLPSRLAVPGLSNTSSLDSMVAVNEHLYFRNNGVNDAGLYRTIYSVDAASASVTSVDGVHNVDALQLSNGQIFFKAVTSTGKEGYELFRITTQTTAEKPELIEFFPGPHPYPGSYYTGIKEVIALPDAIYALAYGKAAEDLSRSFELEGQAVKLSFDFLRLDSWDNEALVVNINGTRVIEQAFSPYTSGEAQSGSSDGFDWSIVPISANEQLNGASHYDQIFKVTISIPAGNPTVDLGIGSTLDQSVEDESYGIRNLEIHSSTEPFNLLLSDSGDNPSLWTGGRANSSATLGTFLGSYSGRGEWNLWKLDSSELNRTMRPLLASTLPNKEYISNLFTVGNTLYFSYDNGIDGRELWQTDGTPSGTHIAANINGQTLPSWPRLLTEVDGKLFFTADDGVQGRGLYRLDTATGEVRRLTIPGLSKREGSYYIDSLTNAGGRLFFRSSYWNDTGTTWQPLFMVDPASGDVMQVSGVHSVANLTSHNSSLFFTGSSVNNQEGHELFSIVPGLSEEPQVIDVNPGIGGSYVQNIISHDENLYFTAERTGLGREIFQLNVSGQAVPLRDIYPGATGSNPRSLFSVGNTVYFIADDGFNGPELWQTDGTESGTHLSKNINNITLESSPNSLIDISGILYFTATDGVLGRGLYRINPAIGSPERLTIPGLTGGKEANIDSLINADGRLYFRLNEYSSTGAYRPLYTLDPATGELGAVPGVTHVDNIKYHDGQVYFTAYTASMQEGYELFRIGKDGTGPKLIDVSKGSGSSDPKNLMINNGTLYFVASAGAIGRELHRLDANFNAVPIANLSRYYWSEPRQMVSAANRLYINQSSSSDAGGPGQDVSRTLILDETASSIRFELQRNDSWDGEAFTVYVDDAPIFSQAFNHYSGAAGISGVTGDISWSMTPSSELQDLYGISGWLDQRFLVELRLPAGRPSVKLGFSSSLDEDSNNESYFIDNLEIQTEGQQTIFTDGFETTAGWTGGVLSSYLGDSVLGPYGRSSASGESWRLWSVDPNSQRIQPVTITGLDSTYEVNSFVSLGDHVFFRNSGWSGNGYNTLYAIDPSGSIANQVQGVTDVTSMCIAGSTLYIIATYENQGSRLLRIDENAEVTPVQLQGGSNPSNLTTVADSIYFTAYARASNGGWLGRELWKIDNVSGNARLIEIRPGYDGSDPRDLVDVAGTLYLIAQGADNGALIGEELYRIDPVTDQIELLADIYPGGNSSNPTRLTLSNGQLYFTANDGSHGQELWRVPINTQATGIEVNRSLIEDETLTFAADDFANPFAASGGGSLQAIKILSLPSNGRLLLGGINCTVNQTIDREQIHELSFKPDSNYHGTSAFNWSGSIDTNFPNQASVVRLAITAVPDAPRQQQPLADRVIYSNSSDGYTFDLNTYADPDLGSSLSYSASLSDGSALPDWITLSGRSFSFNPPLDAAGSYDIRVTATDSDGLTSQDSTNPTKAINWLDWTAAAPGAGTAHGSFPQHRAVTVSLSSSSPLAFAQTEGGSQYFTPVGPYSSGVITAPTSADIIALSESGKRTLTFSRPVQDVYFAYVSINGNTLSFNHDFEIISQSDQVGGPGYFGSGTAIKQVASDGPENNYQLIADQGEPQGVIRFVGPISSLTWTSSYSEYWNGFTIGSTDPSLSLTAPDSVFSLTVRNAAPQHINLSAYTILENSETGAIIGDLKVSDPNSNDRHILTLLDSADGRFAIDYSSESGYNLIVADGSRLDYEAASSHTIRVRATDPTGLSLDRDLTISLLNVSDASTGNLSFSRADYSVNEDGQWRHAVTIQRQNGSDGNISAVVKITSDSAAYPSDYGIEQTTVLFSAGELSKTISIPIINDDIKEYGEKFQLKLTNPSGGATIGLQSTAIVTIEDDDLIPTLELEIGDLTLNEGTSRNISVKRNVNIAEPLTVNLISGDSNRLSVPSTVVIAAGQSSATFTITAREHGLIEPSQTITLLATANGYSSEASFVTINDNDSVALSLTVNANQFSENGGKALVTLSRSPQSDQPLTVLLSSSNDTAVQIPGSVVIPANQSVIAFELKAIDNQLAGQDQVVIITASPTYSGTTTALPSGQASLNLTIIDDEKPSIKLSIDKDFIAESGQAVGTVSRNTESSTELVVNLSSSDPGEASLPASVIIPAGERSATFMITGVSDGESDGNQTVTITGTAAGLNSGSQNLIVTDLNVADLAFQTLEPVQPTFTSTLSQFSFAVINHGIANATGIWKDRVYLSTDDKLDAKDTLLGEYVMGSTSDEANLQPDRFYSRTASYYTPRTPGQYFLIGVTDHGANVEEGGALGDGNNISVSPLSILPAYRGEAETETDIALPGQVITLRGQALSNKDNTAVGFEFLKLRISSNGTSRELDVLTDANGNFSRSFYPLPGEAGPFAVNAYFPTNPNEDAAPEDSFTLLGMRFERNDQLVNQLREHITENSQLNGSLKLQNLSAVPLTNLSASVGGAPSDWGINLSLTESSLSGNAEIQLDYSIHVPDDRWSYYDFAFTISSAEGLNLELPVHVDVGRLLPRLVASSNSLQGSMLRGSQRTVEFDITNRGELPTGPLSLNLPEISWLKTASGTSLPSLAPGESTTVTLLLQPAATEKLEEFQGNLSLTGEEVTLNLPFRFRAVSEAQGNLSVNVADELTRFAAGSPLVENATITLSDPYTGAIIVSEQDPDGIYTKTNLTEGSYLLRVSADRHDYYEKIITIRAGETTHINAFLSRQTVKYRWTVTPTEIEDRYVIHVESVFETNVPIPTVVIEPAFLDLADLQVVGQEMQVDVKATNHGLIDAKDINFNFGNHPFYKIEALINKIDKLGAKESLIVPVRVTRIADFNTLAPAAGELSTQSAPSVPCTISGSIDYSYECGGEEITRDIPLPVLNVEGNCGSTSIGGTPWWPSTGGGLGGGGGGFGGSGGGGTTYVVPVEVVQQDSNCDPCKEKNLQALSCVTRGLGGKAKGIIGGVVGGINCWVNIANGIKDFKEGNYTELPKPSEICDPPEIPDCLEELCLEGLGFGGSGANSQSATSTSAGLTLSVSSLTPSNVSAGMETLSRYKGYWDVVRNVGLHYYGSEVWLKVNEAEEPRLRDWMQEFRSRLEGASIEDFKISEQERQQLLELDYPQPLTTVDIDQFLSRWNRSIDYFASGILRVSDLAPGQNPDFISIDTLENLGTTLNTYKAVLQSEGYQDLDDATYNHSKQLYDAISGQAGVCAQVRIRIDQEAVMTRTAFLGSLEIKNGNPFGLTNLTVTIEIKDQFGKVVNDKFGITSPILKNISAVDGSGVLPGDNPDTSQDEGTGSAQWTFIPTNLAAPEVPTQYSIGGTLSYNENGKTVVVPLETSQPVTVYPQAELHLDYFHQRDVYSDDPFTDDIIETSVPYSLAVLIRNEGKGDAKNLRITSGQPKIIENEKGLLIDFQIIGSEVNGQGATPSLTVDFGDIKAGNTGIAEWLLKSSLQGKFIDYKATFEHVNNLGKAELSLIKDVKIHELVHTVNVNHSVIIDGLDAGSDGLTDFLVNDVFDAEYTPDTLYFSSGGTAPVRAIKHSLVDAQPSSSNLEVDVSATTENGWTYFRLPEPSDSSLDLIAIRRADGSTLKPENFWITDRTFPGTGRPTYENILHFLDATNAGAQTYTLIYQPGGPKVSDIGDVSPDPRSTAINTITVDFSEPINTSSFDHEDLVLRRDNGANLITPEISVVALTTTRYQISGLSALTDLDGDYTLTVIAEDIKDSSGKFGIGSLSESWIKTPLGAADTEPLVVSDVVDLLIDPRNQTVPSLTVNLSKPIDLSSFSSQDLSLTLNGGPNLITSAVTISALTERSYRVSGLSALTEADGTYLFSVIGSGISDLSGNQGSGVATETWLMDTVAPTAPTNLQLITAVQRAGLRSASSSPGELAAPIPTSSSGQLMIASTTPTMTGQLAEPDLSVFIYDQTTDQLLRQASVSGTTFTADLALPGSGARELRIEVQDQAGNFTTSTLNIFADTARPVLTDFPGLPLSSVSPLSSIDVRFSEPIDINSFDLKDISLSRNGVELILPSTVQISHVSGSTYQISGLTALTTSPAEYLLKVDTRSIVDPAGNAGDATMYGEFLISTPPAPGISLLESLGATVVTEGGNADSYRLVLNTQPSSDVIITLSTGDQLQLSTSSLRFTPDNWNTPQTISVSAVDDSLIEGNSTATIVQTISSSDPAYATISMPPLAVQLIDNDAGLSGRIWNDINGNGVNDTEPPLANWTVYLDSNNNSIHDADERSMLTDASGIYSFTDLRPGIYKVAQVVPAGWQQTYPLIPITTTAADAALSIPSLNFTLEPPSGDAILSFSAGNFVVNESGSALSDIVVNRSGNISSAVSVTIQLSDGTAIGCGCAATSVNNDFNYTPILVSFAPGESSKRIPVQNAITNQNNTLRIRNDSKIEGDEYFTISLVQASEGTQLGAHSSARVVIQDDDSPNTGSLPPTGTETTPPAPIAGSGVTSPTELLNLERFWADARFAAIKGSGQSIVVIDTGADLNHSLFGADLNLDGIADRIRFQYDFADRDGDASDRNNHGSHVTSIAASLAPEADLIVLKVFKDSGSGSFADLEQALQWVYTNADTYNIAAVNLSLGDSLNWQTATSQYGIGDELAAIANRNIITSAAAGNGFYSFGSTAGLAYPAADPSVISVGAVWGSAFGTRTFSDGAVDYSTAADRIASFSQRHPLMDVFAPGILISGASADGGLTTMGGTSQAVPFLSGLASLAQDLASHHLGRRLSLSEFNNLLQSSGDLILDGDDENDNVLNTGSAYRRLNLIAFAEAILRLGDNSSIGDSTLTDADSEANPVIVRTTSFSHSVTLNAGDSISELNFGTQLLPIPAVLSISPSTIVQPEGNNGSKIYRFNVSRSGDTSGTSSASWSVVGTGASAANADDFVGGNLLGGTVFFAPGETTTTIDIQVAGDLSVEGDESFLVQLDSATGASIDPEAKTAGGTIVNDDTPSAASVNLSIPTDLIATIGEIIEIPIHIDNPTGALSLDLTVGFDPALFTPDELLPVRHGDLNKGDSPTNSWSLVGNTSTPGRLVISASGTTPLAAAPGSIATLRLRVNPGVKPGLTSLDLIEAQLNEDGPVNLIDGSLSLKAPSFQVRDIRQLASGFAIKLTDTPDLTNLNLYDGLDSSIDPADLQLIGPDGTAVSHLSLHWQESSKELYVLRSDSLTGAPISPFRADLLAPGRYTLSMDSRADGLILSGTKPLTERLLDGNGDGITGDAFSRSFDAISTPTHLIAIGDTARGPGQALSLNGSPLTSGSSGLPVLVSTATALTSLSGTIHFDGTTISNASLARGSALPADWTLNVSPAAGGGFSFTASGNTPISGNDLHLLRFTGAVASSAPYGSTTLVQVSVNSPGHPSLVFASDPGLVAIAFAGDTTGNGKTRPDKPYSSLDASFVQRVVVGLDSGFDAYPVIAPTMIGDLTGNGSLSSLDASLLQQRVVGLPVSSFPEL